MTALLDSLIAQRLRCGGEKCHTRRCKRCARYHVWLATSKERQR